MPEPWHGGWLVAAAPTPRGNLGARASVNETTVSQSGGDAKGWSSDEPAATGGPRMRQGTGRTRVILWRRCGPLYGRVLSMRIGASHPANSPTGTAAPSRAIGAPGPHLGAFACTIPLDGSCTIPLDGWRDHHGDIGRANENLPGTGAPRNSEIDD
jgi:hypothetical protein